MPNLEMPKYKSHKEVRALKIATIDREPDGSARIWPAEEGYPSFEVDAAYVEKHGPQVGGYYVVYEDGYASWSPPEAFEAGYTLIE